MRKLNAHIINKLNSNKAQVALAVLYKATNAGVRCDTDGLVTSIRAWKDKFKATGKDALAERLAEYGNSGGWINSKVETLNQMIYDNNEVYSGKHISVEIECIFPERMKAKFIKAVAKLGLRKNVCVKEDGSIKNECVECERDMTSGPAETDDDDDSGCGHCAEYSYDAAEIVITCRRDAAESIIALVCKALDDNGAFVNKSCGLHVHFDMRDTDKDAVNAIARKLSGFVPNLKKVLPASRRNNTFIKNDLCLVEGSERYAFVNASAYRRHKTIEIRGHSGTADAVKILNWIKLIELLMATTRGTSKDMFFQMLADAECPNELYNFYQSRYNKFEGWKLEGLEQLSASDVSSNEESEAA